MTKNILLAILLATVGLLFEKINRAGGGGIYAEIVQNRLFEDDAKSPVGWTCVRGGGRDDARQIAAAQRQL